MTDTIHKLERLVKERLEYIDQSSELEMSRKQSVEKWSKKEILGHLIDSGIKTNQSLRMKDNVNK